MPASVSASVPASVPAFELNDGHIHYNRDIWKSLSPQQALELLKENNIRRAIVFSRPTEGTEKLYQLAPDKVIPFVMPYRNFRDKFTWHSDLSIVDYVKGHLDSGIYHGIGEFHLYKKHKDSDVARQLMQLAADYKISISAHADYETIITLVEQQPQVRVIWAHCGMSHRVADVRAAIEKYDNLHCELSFRYNMFDDDFNLKPAWKSLFEEHADRFILGMDTYIGRRWANLAEQTEFARDWLVQLSEQARNKIARDNIQAWFP